MLTPYLEPSTDKIRSAMNSCEIETQIWLLYITFEHKTYPCLAEIGFAQIKSKQSS